MAVSELISFATAMPTFPIFDIYLWVAGNRGQAVYFLAWLKSFAEPRGPSHDHSPS
jgi:hypothetical protein